MKFYQPKRIKEFSGRVEIAITPLDKSGLRMGSHDGIERKSIRVEETTPEEIYQIIYEALKVKAEAES